jgi:hypothetical protein
MSKKAGKRKARYAVEPPTIGKQPKIRQSPPSDADSNFAWRVKDRYLDYDYHKLGWCNCDSRTLLIDVIKELQDYEGLTWQKVREKSKHNHSWKFHELPRELKERLRERGLEYLPELFQISLARVPRIWGFKDITTLYLIWYDPQHTGYKTRVE